MSSSDPERESNTPSLTPPASSGGGLYLAGMVLVGGLIVGLVMWKRGQTQDAAPTTSPTMTATPAAVTTATATATVAPNLPEFAPPALRQEDEIPAANAKGGKAPSKGDAVASGDSGEQTDKEKVDAAPKTNCSACGSGTSNATLNGAIRSRAGTAQGCYQRALREGGSEGTITVSVSVGSDGAVCGANVVSDTLNNPAIAGCVLGKFRGSAYPPPTEGCVTVQVPISFKVK
jgi:outer membrane biosynthesis protein TonB